jgi:hypothetical protein
MNTFKKKALFAALAGLGAMGMVGSAQAVSLNPDGLGQVLIYPYYTVRANADGNAFNSLISVVNSTDVGKAVKVRFLEGKASVEVLDFNLYLSPWDVWTGAIVPSDDGEGAKIITRDNSCTAPPIPASGQPFVGYLYQYGSPDNYLDGEDDTLDRTKEGYAEIIEMADIKTIQVAAPAWSVYTATKHVNGVPGNCAYVQDQGPMNPFPAWVATDLTTGTGGLFGSMTLINVNDARDVAFEATALADFFLGAAAGDIIWYPSGDTRPDFGDVYPPTSTVIDKAKVYITPDWNYEVDAVSAVLMNNSVYNEFMLDSGVAGKTDWVVTFPTKWAYYYDPDLLGVAPNQYRGREVWKLFQRNFRQGGACDDVELVTTDREERRPSGGSSFSPRPPTGTDALCWEANVITFGPAGTPSIFYAKNRLTLPVHGYENGWTKFTFKAGSSAGYSFHTLVGDSGAAGTSGATQEVDLAPAVPTVANKAKITFTGLPMVGFAAQLFNNGEVQSPSLGKVWASYAGRINHRFSKSIVTQ